MPCNPATVPAAVIPANFCDNTLATAPFFEGMGRRHKKG